MRPFLKVFYLIFYSVLSENNDVSTTSSTSNVIAAGYSLILDGVQDYFTISSNEFVDIGNDATVSAWIKIAARLPPNHFRNYVHHVFGHPFGHGPKLKLNQKGDEYFIWVEMIDQEEFIDDCAFIDRNTLGLSSESNLNDTKWHHIALTMNERQIFTFFDSKAYGVCNRTVTTTPVKNTRNVHLGMCSPHLESNRQAFAGQVDEVAYIKRQASEDEINALSRGINPLHLFDVNDVLIYSDFNNDPEKRIRNHGNSKLKWSSNRRSPKYKPSGAPITGHMIAEQNRAVPTGKVSDIMEVVLKSRTHNVVHFTVLANSEGDVVKGGFLVPKDTECIIPSEHGKTSFVPMHYTTPLSSDYQHVPAKWPFQCTSKRLIFQPLGGERGKLSITLKIILSEKDNVNNLSESKIEVVFEVMENRAPIAGTGGNNIYCDGKDDYLFNKDFKWPIQQYGDVSGGGPITIQYWSWTPRVISRDAAVLSIGNGDVAMEWMDALNPYSKKGLLLVRSPNQSGGAEMLVGSSTRIAVDLQDEGEVWTHYTFTHDQASGNTSKIYINGKLKASINHQQIGVGQNRYPDIHKSLRPVATEVVGLSVCAWTMWSGIYHKGFLDELRIWNRTLGEDEINEHMYKQLTLPQNGLMAYYTFDEPNNERGIATDSSGNGYDLIYGGCAPCESSFMGYQPRQNPRNQCLCAPLLPGNETCMDGENVGPYFESDCGNRVCKPTSKGVIYGGHPCYYMPTEKLNHSLERVPDERWPELQSKHPAPLGRTSQVIKIDTGTTTNINLPVTDPDSEDMIILQITILRIPEYGRLFTWDSDGTYSLGNNSQLAVGYTSVSYEPQDEYGGDGYDYFDYKVSDGFLDSLSTRMYFTMPCLDGHFKKPVDGIPKCFSCPIGSHRSSMPGKEECSVCRGNKYQDERGQKECKRCALDERANEDHTGCEKCPTSPETFHEVTRHIYGNSCPAILFKASQTMVLQINDSPIEEGDTREGIPKVALVTSLPIVGELFQFVGYESDGTTPVKGEKIQRISGKILSSYAVKVLEMCGDKVPFNQQDNSTTFPILNDPRLESVGYGTSDLAWSTCDRPHNSAYRKNSITVQLDKKMIISTLAFYENFIPGGVTLVEAYDPNTHDWHTLFSKQAQLKKKKYRRKELKRICPNKSPTDVIRITTEYRGSQPPELDAVQVFGVTEWNAVHIGTPILDEQFRVVYSYPSDVSIGQASFNFMLRECTAKDARMSFSQVKFALPPIVAMAQESKGSESSGSAAMIPLLGTFVPVIFMLLIFMIVHNANQRKKEKSLQNQLDCAHSTLPQSAFVDICEVIFRRETSRNEKGTCFMGEFRGVPVALKLLCITGRVSSTELKVAVEKEAKRMCNIRHPNIVTFMGCCLHPIRPFVMTQYCTRGTLQDLLQDINMELPWLCRMRMAVGVTRGLLYLHSARPPYIHGDIKSCHIYVDDSWTAKLGNFGTDRLAEVITCSAPAVDFSSMRWTAPEVLLRRTRSSSRYNYMAPTQLTPAIDVYSLGVVLWEIATRKVPYYEVSDSRQVADQILQGHRLNLSQTLGCPQGYSKVVERCLEWNAVARITAGQLLLQLETLLRKMEVAAAAAQARNSRLQLSRMNSDSIMDEEVISPRQLFTR